MKTIYYKGFELGVSVSHVTIMDQYYMFIGNATSITEAKLFINQYIKDGAK